jgi:hypothetical protein
MRIDLTHSRIRIFAKGLKHVINLFLTAAKIHLSINCNYENNSFSWFLCSSVFYFSNAQIDTLPAIANPPATKQAKEILRG